MYIHTYIMARLLKSEIYAEINAHLCGLKHLDKENKYKTQLDELEIQNKDIFFKKPNRRFLF